MKKTMLTALAVLAGALCFAQQQMPLLPIDPAVRIGQLENGLTYYIRHNEEPKGQANFYIAQKVGSILEEEDQRGLAHFLEHMCFNGTQNFPGNGVIKYCESIGVKFGADLNAYTSIDETVYNIDNVPVQSFPTAIDSCLLILHDWAGALLLEGDDIDHERGVIHEEWRSRQNASMRMYEKILPEIYPGNKYGQRLPIGTMEVVDNFPYEAIRAYYHKWYRPDQQGIVVVGDIDVDEVEAKIASIFGSLPAAGPDAAERYYLPIEKNVEPIISIAKDKEQPYAMAYIFKKHDAVKPEEKVDLNYGIYHYALNAAELMIRERIEEMLQKPDPDFVEAGIDDEEYFVSKTEYAFTGYAVTDENQLLRGITSVYREMLRVIRNGFTASEYDRARQNILTNLETQFNQREKKTSGSYCREYVRHFIDNEPIMGIENRYTLTQQIAPMIPVEAINQIIASIIEPNNLVVVCMLPDKDGVVYPTEDEIKAALAAVEAEEIAPYEDKVSDEPLIAKLPKAGKVKKTEAAPFGYTKLTFKNGATVYFQQTDFNADEVIFRATSFGGRSLYGNEDIITLSSLGELIDVAGLGNFSSTELTKALTGKKVSLGATVNEYQEALRGKSTPKDFETLLQLNYLYFTALRSDEEAFQSWKTKTAAMLANQEAQPMSALQDSIKVLYADPNRAYRLKSADIDKVDYARAMQIAAERFSNAADFTFIITGAISLDEAKPLLEQYIGSLPAKKNKKESFKLSGYEFREGPLNVSFERQMGTPMATSLTLESAKIDYSLKNDLTFEIACQTLSMVLLEEIREKEGATYSIGAYGSTSSVPYGNAYVQILYQTNPEKVAYTDGRVNEIVAEFIANGPSAENLAKAKEYLAKEYKADQRENTFWSMILQDKLISGEDMQTGYLEVLDSITAEDAAALLKTIIDQNNKTVIVMVGVE
ncbi:MAG: insulinase family protein [Bacteroidales bacterium]|nr:insulinase family protein [Bacteroidales bacterium]